MQKVFYSWQSDKKSVRNKFKRALEIAVKQIGESLEEANRPELDSDIQGTFASVKITETILKKIDGCAVFVADVTPITKVGDKLIPNPNVMAELGYALKTKDKHSLFVFCYDGERPERNMPFDIWSHSLLRFRTTDTPSEIAKDLSRRIQGILDNPKPPDLSDFPNIYVRDAKFERWSDGTTINLTIRNAESTEYMLAAIEIEGKSAEPFKSLQANTNTSGIVINGVTQIFADTNPLIKMTVRQGGKTYRLEQTILTVKGADDRHHFQEFVEQSIPVRA